MNTQNEISEQIRNHKYVPRATMGDLSAHCPGCEDKYCPGIGYETDSGNATKLIEDHERTEDARTEARLDAIYDREEQEAE